LFGYGLRVVGSLRLRETRFQAPPERRMRGDEPAHYALDLYGADIRDDLLLYPHNAICGGLRIRAAHIGGDVRFADLRVTDGFDENDGTDRKRERRKAFIQTGIPAREALDGTSCYVGGNFFFQSVPGLDHFASDGPVTLFGFEIKGTLALSGARFEATDCDRALALTAGTIGGNIVADTLMWARRALLTIHGNAIATGLNIKGSAILQGTLTNLEASGLTVRGDTTLALQVQTVCYLRGANLKGQLDLSAFTFPRPENIKSRTSNILNVRDADVGHTLFLASSASTTPLHFESCRRRILRCYPKYHLFDIKVDQGMASLLVKRGKKPLLLDGVSSYLHRLNRSGALDLSTSAAVKDYIRFFGAYVWGDLGPFAVVESLSVLPEGSLSEAAAKELPIIGEMILVDQFQETDWDYLKGTLKEAYKRDLTSGEWDIYENHFRVHAVKAQAMVRYGAQLFRAEFMVLKAAVPTRYKERFGSGWIAMVNDDPIAELNADKLPVYSRPLIKEQSQDYSDYHSDVPVDDIPLIELTLRVPTWKELLERPLARFQNAEIDLTNLSCRTLEDADGRAWGEDISSIKLENFTYTRVGSPSTSVSSPNAAGRLLLFLYRKKDRIPASLISPALFRDRPRAATTDRLSWLKHMPRKTFLPQPYAQLASVLNSSGDTDGAKAIEERKILLEVRDRSRNQMGQGLFSLPLRISYRLIWALFRVAFRYGLSPVRASTTVLLCLILGWVGVTTLNEHGYLVQNTSTAATLLAKDPHGDLSAVFPYTNSLYRSPDLRCGGTINGLLYATDVFIPLLDLRQESRCDIRSPSTGDIDPEREWAAQKSVRTKINHYLWAVAHAPVLWAQFAKSAYAIIGWIVISLTILTYSGTLRRWENK